MAILAIGIITLVFYALNPLEPFMTSAGQTQSPLDLQTLIAKYRSMTSEEREQLRYEIHQRRIMAAASEKPVVTLSDVQGLINSQVQSQLANQPIQSCGLSKSYDNSPSYNEILKAAEEQREKMERKQFIKDKRREIQKKTMDTQQINYRPRQVTTACPSPDPSIWIKRNEIPCWNCKV